MQHTGSQNMNSQSGSNYCIWGNMKTVYCFKNVQWDKNSQNVTRTMLLESDLCYASEL